MDIKEITNHVQDWCLEDKEKRCAIIIIAEKEEDGLRRILGILGKSINLKKAVYGSIKNSKEFYEILQDAIKSALFDNSPNRKKKDGV